MSSSSRPDGQTGGFILFEVLVALVIGGLVLAAFAQTHALARRASRMPDDVMATEAVASGLLRDLNRGDIRIDQSGERNGLRYSLRTSTLELVPLRQDLVPLITQDRSNAPRRVQPQLVRIEIEIVGRNGKHLVMESAGVASQAQ